MSVVAPLAVLLALPLAAGAAEPTPAPLSSAPPPAATSVPARALPATVTICRGGTGPRCWVRPGEDGCAPNGAAFRVVLDRPADVAAALEACAAPADGAPAP